ncbi:MAG: FHA domain-containing protein [Planctomycetaceae bacterium]|nr:FHA domain-containing protein [Planctomycetaceae bacterium]
MAVYLVPLAGGRSIVVDKAVVFVGRHPDCDVIITHSRKVSRKHCCICQVNEFFVVRDLGSMNGIRVNGKRVKKEARISFGDEVSIGDVPFKLQKTKPEAPPSAPKGAVVSKREPRPNPRDESTPRKASAPQIPPVPSRPKVPSRRAAELSQEFPIAIPDDGESFAVIDRRGDPMDTVGPKDDDIPDAIILDDDSQSGSDVAG